MIAISKACASCGVIVSVNNSLYGFPVNSLRHGGAEEEVPRPRRRRQGRGLLRPDGSRRRLRRRGARLQGGPEGRQVHRQRRQDASSPTATWPATACWPPRRTPPSATRAIINLIVDLKEHQGLLAWARSRRRWGSWPPARRSSSSRTPRFRRQTCWARPARGSSRC
ncbi:MAG: hypothetical protein MZV70_40570 [Desulfobacterales bacterium]|nr:hypothetical protein [Desulfobacterales bacterium]